MLNTVMRPFFALVLAIVATTTTHAVAQSVQGIAAVVNDEVVSIRDLRQRIRLILFSSGIDDTAETQRRIANQVLRSLIDERLQLQEAQKRNVAVSDEDIERNIADIEKRNGMEPNSLPAVFERNRVSSDSLRAQLRAQIAWTVLARRRLMPRINIGADEIDEILARLEASEGEDTYRLGEIFLSVNSPDDESAIRETARRLVDQIRGGARFNALARQFSQTATAAVGGDLGWTPRSALDPAVAAAVHGLTPGQVLDPIRTISGFRIVTLINKRRIATADPNETVLELRQIFVPIPDGIDQARRDARIEAIGSEATAIDGCGGLPAAAERLGADAPQDLGSIKQAELSAEIRKGIADVAVGKASQPMKAPGGIVLMVVCGRTVPELNRPTRSTVGARLRQQRLDLSAQRYLRDLRSAAVIDIRI